MDLYARRSNEQGSHIPTDSSNQEVNLVNISFLVFAFFLLLFFFFFPGVKEFTPNLVDIHSSIYIDAMRQYAIEASEEVELAFPARPMSFPR